jgi:membrane protein YdbS with pleckstrin-like domain
VPILSISNLSRALPGILATLVGVAGWFYLFYSRAASNLSNIEDQKVNKLRGTLRRVGALVMLLLATLIAVGAYAFDIEHPGPQFFLTWIIVLALLMVIVILGLIDVRLTYKLRHTFRQKRQQP